MTVPRDYTQPEVFNVDPSRIIRTEHQVLVSIAQLLEESLAVQRHILKAVTTLIEGSELASSASNPDASERRSSVEIKTSTRGVDIAVKTYQGSDILEAESAAVSSYFRVLNEIQDRLMNGGQAK